MSDNLFSQDPTEKVPNEAIDKEAPAEPIQQSEAGSYTDDSIQTLSWNEHIRRRPGMYIGKLGDGSHTDDGIYILIKEVVDNSIDEFNMGMGQRIDITIRDDGEVSVRDYVR